MDRKFVSKDKDGKELKLVFRKPTQKIINEADFLFKAHFSKCLRAKLITNVEAFKIMKESGLWTDADDETARNLRKQIGEIEQQFTPELPVAVGTELILKLGELRDQLSELNLRHSSVTENTAETVANESRLLFWAANCVYSEDGKRIFKDADDLLARSGEVVAIDSYREAMLLNMQMAYGVTLSSNPLDDLPENKWLAAQKKVEPTTVDQVSTEPALAT